MNRFLVLSIFLSLVLFSCSKSTEDKIVGSWIDPESNVTITFNSDKTSTLSRNGETRSGAWSFNEESMNICTGESTDERDLDCATLISVDNKAMCVEERGETMCLNKINN